MKTLTLPLTVGLLLSLPLVGQATGGPLDTRFASQGSFRLDGTPDDDVQDLALDSQGRIYLALRWQDPSLPLTFWPVLLRLTPSGALDTTFGFLGVWFGDANPAVRYVVRVAVDSQDRPLVGWTTDSDPGANENLAWVVRRLPLSGLTTDYQVIVQFNWGDSLLEQLTDLVVLADGRVLLAGTVDFTTDDTDFALAMLKDDGSGGLELDTAFSGDGRTTVAFDLPSGRKSDLLAAARQQGSRLWLVGDALGASDALLAAVARIDLATGNLDGTFNGSGKATYQYTPLGGPTWQRTTAIDCAPRPAGGLVLAGLASETFGSTIRLMALAIDSTGSPEPTWGVLGWYVPDLRYPGYPFDTTDGLAEGVAVDASGRTLLVGQLRNPVAVQQGRALAVRLTSLGGLDSSFSSDGVELYTFESSGEPFRDRFAPVLLTDDDKLALVGGRTRGETTAGDDLLAARIIVNSAIFEDGFESGNLSAWGQ